MADEYTPTTERVRDLFTWAHAWRTSDEPGSTDLSKLRASNRAEFDRFLAAYEAEVRERIAQDIEAEAERMILTSDAWTRGEERHLDGLGLAARIARGATR